MRWLKRRRKRAPYSVAVIDPSWNFKDKLPGPGRGAVKHYKTSPVQIMADYVLSVLDNRMADNCVLAMWRVAAMQYEALEMMKLLDFTLKSEIVWLKRTKYGKRHMGMGRQCRLEHEVCLIGTRGKNIQMDRAVRSVFMECGFCNSCGFHKIGVPVPIGDPQDLDFDEMCNECGGTGAASDTEMLRVTSKCSPSIVFEAEASRKHSEKPQAFFDIMDRLYGGKKIELFARDRRPGWDADGWELDRVT